MKKFLVGLLMTLGLVTGCGHQAQASGMSEKQQHEKEYVADMRAVSVPYDSFSILAMGYAFCEGFPTRTQADMRQELVSHMRGQITSVQAAGMVYFAHEDLCPNVPTT